MYRGTRISEAHIITECDRVEGLLSAAHRYDDDDDSEDSEDEGWLRRVKYRSATTLQGRAAFRPSWVDIGMVPARITVRIPAAVDRGGV